MSRLDEAFIFLVGLEEYGLPAWNLQLLGYNPVDQSKFDFKGIQEVDDITALQA